MKFLKYENNIAKDRNAKKPVIINRPIAYSSDERIHNDVSPINKWDPLVSFKDAFKNFWCPRCQLLESKKSPMTTTSILKDGSNKQRAPRSVYDVNHQIMLVSRVYRCTVNKQHTISS